MRSSVRTRSNIPHASQSDVEAAFEGVCNYVYIDDDVTRPERKVKVIKVEAITKG
jgi:hypothetical protein